MSWKSTGYLFCRNPANHFYKDTCIGILDCTCKSDVLLTCSLQCSELFDFSYSAVFVPLSGYLQDVDSCQLRSASTAEVLMPADYFFLYKALEAARAAYASLNLLLLHYITQFCRFLVCAEIGYTESPTYISERLYRRVSCRLRPAARTFCVLGAGNWWRGSNTELLGRSWWAAFGIFRRRRHLWSLFGNARAAADSGK